MIVFLDCDDVLNIPPLYKNSFIVESYFLDMTTVEEFDEAIKNLFTEEAMEVLRWLCDEYDPEFVISSTWRKDFTKEQFELMFHANNLPCKLHEDWKTDEIGLRDEQIQRWIDDHPEETIHLILDDSQSGFSLVDSKLEYKTLFCDRWDQTDEESHNGSSLNPSHKYWIRQIVNYQKLGLNDE